MNKPWSQDFNPRRDGEHVAEWLQREVALTEKLGADGKPTRCITLTSREASQLLALADQQPPVHVYDDAAIERAVRAHDREDAAQKGEPDPWADEFPDRYRSERMTAMRLAFDAAEQSQAAAEGGAA